MILLIYDEAFTSNDEHNSTDGTLLSKCFDPNTGWPKSNVSKVRAHCSASDYLIRKIFSGVSRDSHWFEEYLKIIEIGHYFFE